MTLIEAMAVRYYKKLIPGNLPRCQNGSSLDFKSKDLVTSYYATDQLYPQQQIEIMMAENRYGITEITAEEFHRDYVEKKTEPMNSAPPWREELSKSGVSQGLNRELVNRTGSAAVLAAVAVTEPVKAPPVSVAEPAAAPAPKAKFIPTSGRRPKKA